MSRLLLLNASRKLLLLMPAFVSMCLTTELTLAQHRPQLQIFAPSFSPAVSYQEDSTFFNDSAMPHSKSTFLAAVLSFVLPGLGEVYAERFDSGQYFLAADIALAVGFIALTVYGNVQRADYQSYARLYANISGEKNDDFWRDIADWQSRDTFNQSRLQRRQYALIYPSADDWQWVSEAHRLRYREMRIASETAFQVSYYVLAAMGINRLLSAINAVRQINASSDATGSNTFTSPCFFATLHSNLDGLQLSFKTSF